MTSKFLFLLFLGLLIRVLLIPQPGFVADIAFWKSWSLAAGDHGIIWMNYHTNCNYPSGFGFVLWLMGKAYRLLSDPHDFYQYWRETNYPFLFVVKMPSIISDLFIAVIIYYLLKNPQLLGLKKPFLSPYLGAALYLFNPVSLFDGAYWGQVDSLGVFLFLVSLLFLLKERIEIASLFYVISFLTKLQNIIYAPLFFVYIGRRYSFDKTIKAAATSLFSFFAYSFPFVIAHDMRKVIHLLVVNADWFPLLSLNAFNLWWIVANGKGMEISDKILMVGTTSAKGLGLILFSASYFLSLALVFFKPLPENLILACLASVFSFFILPTQSHERYVFPFIVFSILSLAFIQKKRKFLRTLIFVLFTINSFYNLHTSMAIHYPENSLSFLAATTKKSLTIVSSFINLGILLLVFFIIIKRLTKPVLMLITALGLILLGLLLKNQAYLFPKKVSLASLSPIAWRQDYKGPVFNLSVDSTDNPQTWKFLSSNYFFYRQGIGGHAHSEISFDLARKFKKFSTDYGVDSEAGTQASVVFKIIGDEKVLFVSEKMGRFDLPRHIDLDIQGIKTLILVVEDAGDGIHSDHADWLNPVLYR